MRDQRKADADHLRLLAIFHFVGAGLAVLAIGFLGLHYLFMHTFLGNPDMWKNQRGAVPPPKEFFELFKWFYVFFGVWLVVSCLLNVLSGIFIGERKCRTFSLVVAFINCIHIPFGTVLGVFTIVVLLRASVREVYEAQQRSSASDAGVPPSLV